MSFEAMKADPKIARAKALRHAKTTLIAGGVPRGELPYKRSLAIWEKTLGPDHPMLGTSLNDLAELYRDQGRYPRPSRSTSATSPEPAIPMAMAISTGQVSQETMST